MTDAGGDVESIGRARRRVQFSLVQLIVAVSLVSIGVALMTDPRTYHGCGYSQSIAKAREDLDVLRQAILLHDSQQPPLRGTSLQPLLGRYLQEIPKDPWGRDYMLDTNLGKIECYGEDGVPGGTRGNDTDVLVEYKPSL